MDELCQAAVAGDVDDVRRLVEGKELASDECRRGTNMPIHYAAMARSRGPEVTAVLLEAKADIYATTNESKQAIHIAAENEQGAELVSLLIAARANPDAQTLAARTPLHFAAIEGVFETTRVLLAAGAKVNAMNSCGAIPLHWAAKTGKKDLCDLLVEAKSDLQAMDNLGRNAAGMAEDNRKFSVAESLRAVEARM